MSHEFVNGNELKTALTQLALKSRKHGLVLDLEKVDVYKSDVHMTTDSEGRLNIHIVIPLVQQEFELYQLQVIPMYFFQANKLYLNNTIHSDFLAIRNGVTQFFPVNIKDLNRHCIKQKDPHFLWKNYAKLF